MKPVLVAVLLISFFIVGCIPVQKETAINESVNKSKLNISVSYYPQPMTQEGAQKTAEKFAREWEQKDFTVMYELFVQQLQELKNKQDFAELMDYSEKEKTVVIRLDKVSMESESEAYAYYTVTSSLFDVKAPAMQLIYVNDSWRVNAFANYFVQDLKQIKLSIFVNKTLELNALSWVVFLSDKELLKEVGLCSIIVPAFEKGTEVLAKVIAEREKLEYPPEFEEYMNHTRAADNYIYVLTWAVASDCRNPAIRPIIETYPDLYLNETNKAIGALKKLNSSINLTDTIS